ncbi:hypothetical protein TNCT_416951 [Trichonephila clavata]|uniref:Uncharacterized protein n=1 Tax=Trichonephila clavata TaxID=2740835 RepID=A0A8X6HM22_TRICU|nr:hypothetical protein TNCT_416951 [Trichonephila clavata]
MKFIIVDLSFEKQYSSTLDSDTLDNCDFENFLSYNQILQIEFSSFQFKYKVYRLVFHNPENDNRKNRKFKEEHNESTSLHQKGSSRTLIAPQNSETCCNGNRILLQNTNDSNFSTLKRHYVLYITLIGGAADTHDVYLLQQNHSKNFSRLVYFVHDVTFWVISKCKLSSKF